MPFVNFAPIVAGTNGISPIFLTTVSVTRSGIDLDNWVKKVDEDTVHDNEDPYSADLLGGNR